MVQSLYYEPNKKNTFIFHDNKIMNISFPIKQPKLTKKKIIALGGINEKNLKKLKLLDIYGYSGISLFNPKKNGPTKIEGPLNFLKCN